MNSSFYRVKRLCLLLIFLSLSVDVYSQGKIDSAGMTTLRIDPQSARGANVSDVFSEVKFIPLETTKESLFGSISDLKIIKNQFVIYDYDTRSILIFANNGKFKTKIDASRIPKDDGDKAKPELYGYQTTVENGDTLLVIPTRRYFFYFDLTGKLVKKGDMKALRIDQGGYAFADKETIARSYFTVRKGTDSITYKLAIIRKDKDTIGYLPFSVKQYQTDQFLGSSRLYHYGSPNEFFFVDVYNYNLYKVKPSGVSLAYRIIFPANNSMPADFTTNPAYVGRRIEYFQKNQKVFYGVSNSYLFGDDLYLQMHSFGYDKQLKKAIIYNLKTTELTSLQDLEPDSLSSFLPVTDAGVYDDFSNHGFHLYQDGYFYTSYSSLAMFSFKEQLGTKHDQFSPEMQAYFKTEDRKSNPIIVQLKPKQY
jgi:hypothetical protein